MTDSSTYDQNMVGGGEVMEVMMTGGDGGEMNEDTLAQVVNMLQMEGQLTGGNHTIIIRQPGSNEIQMIQTTNNGGELIVTKASEADIQALQAGNGILENVGEDILDAQQGQVMMMDEGGNLVEGVVQMQDEESQGSGEVMQLTQDGQLQALADVQNGNLLGVPKNGVVESQEILEGFVQMDGVGTQSLMESALHDSEVATLSTKPITISTTTSKPKTKTTSGLNGEIVSIKIKTGLSRKTESKPPRIPPKNVIKISTVTGQQKYQPPKFHKCEACAINFVSKVAFMNHMENCPSKRKSLSAVNNKGSISYTCVFCETKFTSRLVLMQHVRTCDKAKSSKNVSANSKLKVTTSESKLKLSNTLPLPKIPEGIKKPKKLLPSSKLKENKAKLPFRKKSILDPEDEPFAVEREDLDSEYEDEKDIVYDDEEDINEEELLDDDNIEETMANKRSQKHLGPIIVKGMFKCRDCNRTFSKEYQYNRHVKACTNAPLNSSRIDADKEFQGTPIPVSAGEAVPPFMGQKRKRGRPPLKDYGSEDGSPAKKRALGPKIVSVNPKKIGSVRGKPRFMNYSDNESDEEILNYLSGGSSRAKEEAYGKTNDIIPKSPIKPRAGLGLYSSSSSLSKIVKISPSDTLIKQTGKAILSKMNKEKSTKFFKETPFCGLCGDKFKNVQELSLHTQICHSEDLLNLRDSLDGKGNLSAVKCPLCDFHFVSPHILLLHMVSFHEKELKTVQDELEMQNLNLVCSFCSETSLTQDLLKEHLATRHLDKLINKPSTTVSPMAIDVHAFIKEKNNGSILPSSKLLSKKERVLCPECGLYFFKSYFEHHRCAAEAFSLSARQFICSESQCSELSFYKLIHLLTHLQQVHEKSLSCETGIFDSLTQFLEWLKREEIQTKMKFTKALQRMKQGKLSTVWICHRFHNAMGDPTSVGGRNETRLLKDRLNQCYSRIHTETCYNNSTSRYDGKTSIRYYPDHRHTSEVGPTKPDQEQKIPKLPAPPLQEKPLTSLTPFNTEESTFSNAAELKQLLEDDEEFVGSKSKTLDNSFDANQLARFAELEKIAPEEPAMVEENVIACHDSVETTPNHDNLTPEDSPLAAVDGPAEEHIVKKDEEESLSSTGDEKNIVEESLPAIVVEESLPAMVVEESSPAMVEKTVDKLIEEDESLSSTVEKPEKIIDEEESLPSSELSEEKIESKVPKEVSGLVSLSDADLLLEKMLGEHVEEGGSSPVVAMETEESHSSPPQNEEELENLAPTEAKITDVDMLEAFGDCITPEESSNSTTFNTQQNSVSSDPADQDIESSSSAPVLEPDPIPVLNSVVESEPGKEDSPSVSTSETKEGEEEEDEVEEEESKRLEEAEEDIDEDYEEVKTFVLPADVEEWNKLFELVSAQLTATGITEAEIEEAKTLLNLESEILTLHVEKQLEVFNRLCALANVQMT